MWPSLAPAARRQPVSVGPKPGAVVPHVPGISACGSAAENEHELNDSFAMSLDGAGPGHRLAVPERDCAVGVARGDPRPAGSDRECRRLAGRAEDRGTFVLAESGEITPGEVRAFHVH